MRMSDAPGRSIEVVLPTDWPRPRGYANAMRIPAGRDLLVVAGQVGWDESERIVGPGFVAQFRQALANVLRWGWHLRFAPQRLSAPRGERAAAAQASDSEITP